MARSEFGGTPGDTVFSTTPDRTVRLSAAVLTVWSGKAIGAAQLIDLLIDDVPTTTIPVDSNGQIPVFEGPDGVTEVWISADGGPRAVLRAGGSGTTTGGGGGSVGLVDNGDGTLTITASSSSVIDNGDGTLTLA
jgi:hypothetical protein